MTALPQQAARAAQETRSTILLDGIGTMIEDRKQYDEAYALCVLSIARSQERIAAALEAIATPPVIVTTDQPPAKAAAQAALAALAARQGQVRDVAEGDPAYLEEQGR